MPSYSPTKVEQFSWFYWEVILLESGLSYMGIQKCEVFQSDFTSRTDYFSRFLMIYSLSRLA